PTLARLPPLLVGLVHRQPGRVDAADRARLAGLLTRRASLLGTDTTIQTVVHDGMRGRVMSMMTVILFGFATAGALGIGFVGDRIGVPRALAGGGVIIALVASAVLACAPGGRAQALASAPDGCRESGRP